MRIKVKLTHSSAVMPSYAKPGDAGADLTAVTVSHHDFYTEYGTGLAIEIPQGYVGLLFPRSSCSNYSQVLANCVGVIDENFRGEVKLRFKEIHKGSLRDLKAYKVGDRVGQLIVIPREEMQFEEAEEFGDTERGSQGFGSSGS